MKLYRGTQRPDIKGWQKLTSWTPSLPVAVIYSALPSDIFRGRGKAEFLEGSTVHMADLKEDAKILELCGGYHDCAWSHLMESLDFGKPEGITKEEAKRVLNYLHNRLIGKALGGEFNYKVYEVFEDADWEEMDMMAEVDWLRGETLVSHFRDFEIEEGNVLGGVTMQLVADTFIFADAPMVRKVAKRLGYDALMYQDVFGGGPSAAKDLLGCEDIEDVPGISMEWDNLSDEEDAIATHDTVRPLHDETLTNLRSVPVEELLGQVQCEEALNPHKLKAKLLR